MKNLLSALVTASQKFGTVEKNTPNAFTKSKYADLSAVLNAVRQPMLDAGLIIVQSPVTRETERGFMVDIVTTIYHAESGEHMENILPMPVTKADAQGIGSAITYGRRYALVSMLNLSTEDDDGNEATATNSTARKTATPTRQSQQAQKPVQPATETPAPATSGNGHKQEPADNPFANTIPFTITGNMHENAVEWAMTRNVYDHLNHARNSYKKHIEACKWKVGVSREDTEAMLRGWVAKVESKDIEREAA